MNSLREVFSAFSAKERELPTMHTRRRILPTLTPARHNERNANRQSQGEHGNLHRANPTDRWTDVTKMGERKRGICEKNAGEMDTVLG